MFWWKCLLLGKAYFAEHTLLRKAYGVFTPKSFFFENFLLLGTTCFLFVRLLSNACGSFTLKVQALLGVIHLLITLLRKAFYQYTRKSIKIEYCVFTQKSILVHEKCNRSTGAEVRATWFARGSTASFGGLLWNA
jgi:hypothetical protein